MNNPKPENWISTVSRAAWTLLLVAIVVMVVQHVIVAVLPGLLVVLALLGIYRIAIGAWRRDSW